MTSTPPRLSIVAAAPTQSPLRLATIQHGREQVEEYRRFCYIVHDLLPDEANDILAKQSDAAVIHAFIAEIEKQYFPIRDDEVDALTGLSNSDENNPWEYLNAGALVEPYGFCIGEAHEFADMVLDMNAKAGETLMPILMGIGQIAIGEDPGIRTTWRDAAAQRFGQELIQRIPQNGYDASDVVIT